MGIYLWSQIHDKPSSFQWGCCRSFCACKKQGWCASCSQRKCVHAPYYTCHNYKITNSSLCFLRVRMLSISISPSLFLDLFYLLPDSRWKYHYMAVIVMLMPFSHLGLLILSSNLGLRSAIFKSWFGSHPQSICLLFIHTGIVIWLWSLSWIVSQLKVSALTFCSLEKRDLTKIKLFFSQPYDFLSLIPVIEGAGGRITNWNGTKLNWEASPDSQVKSKISSSSQ